MDPLHFEGEASTLSTENTETRPGTTPSDAVANPPARAVAAEPEAATSSTEETETRSALPYVKVPPKVGLPGMPPGPLFPQPPAKRIHLPRAEELAALPGALKNVARFRRYESVFGQTVPSRKAVHEVLTAAYGWTTLRRNLLAYTEHIAMQEVDAWVSARSYMRRLHRGLEGAIEADPEIGTQNEDLVQFLGVKKKIAVRARATREANEAAEAAGEAPYAGRVGERKKRRALKAALEKELATQRDADAAGRGREGTP